MNDAKISKLLQTDPQSGLTELIRQYGKLASKICSRLLAGHPEDIEETTADTFISIWKAADRIDPQRGSLKSLVAITARNNAINRLKYINRQAIPLEETEALFIDTEDALARMLAKENSCLLQQLINALPEPNREIFVRRMYLLESVKDISQKTGLDAKQISNRIYQTKLQLRQELEERSMMNNG